MASSMLRDLFAQVLFGTRKRGQAVERGSPSKWFERNKKMRERGFQGTSRSRVGNVSGYLSAGSVLLKAT